VDLSEFHFNVAFRNSVGASPHEYLNQRRIERAQQLMLSTAMPLCEIATECGLADQAHLSRLFRKLVGETPAAWRKNRIAQTSGASRASPTAYRRRGSADRASTCPRPG
jgi:AraC-like DNA-binding protein